MHGGVKRTIMCSHCDYIIKGSIKEVDSKMKRHMKIKHDIGMKDVTKEYLGVKTVDNINSNVVDIDFIDNMEDILKILLKK